MPYTVYILECADQTFYTGCTNNLERRLKQHNESKSGAHYTKIRRPVTLKYSELYETISEARRRESTIKKLKREEKEALFRKIRNNHISMIKEKTLGQYAEECAKNCKKYFSTKNASELWEKPEIIDYFANLPIDQPLAYMEDSFVKSIDPSNKKILIIGGGTGRLGRHIATKHPSVYVTEIDTSSAMVAGANEMAIKEKISDRFLSKKVDLLSNAFHDKEFDFILAYGVFRYIEKEDWPKAIEEIKRLSKFGAIIAEGKAERVIYELNNLLEPKQKVEEIRMPMSRTTLFYILHQLYKNDEAFHKKIDTVSKNANKTISALAGEDVGIMYKIKI